MISSVLLHPFRFFLSGYFNDDQITSFLAGAFTVGLLWLLKFLQECIPDKFIKEWTFSGSSELEDDEDDDFSASDPWNAPLTYVSTQQRRMVSTMVDIQKNIGELPKRFKRKHWPWETIRRKVLGEESDNEEDKDDVSATSKTHDFMTSSMAGEEKKDDDLLPSNLRSGSSGGTQDNENQKKSSELDENENGAKKDEKQLCIGSIFGLDVGGTLAKLVYFEKKPLSHDPLQARSLREKHYVKAVSAQTVLMARANSQKEIPSRGQFAEKRSSSMSPMRKFPRPIITEQIRVRSSTADELEFQDDHNKAFVVPNKIPPINRVSGHMPKRRTTTIKDSAGSIQEKDDTILPALTLNDSRYKKSTEDLKDLYAIRQESLPDDIRQFQNSVGFFNIPTQIKESQEAPETDPCFDSKDDDVDNDAENDSLSTPPESALPTPTAECETTIFGKKRSLSMLDLSAQHDRQKAEALNRFYDFARRLDTNEDSISDIQLSFYCRELGGEFHFISFETRKMKNAMDLIRFNNLHMNIQNMGATGGGAHKFADIWEQELGIGMIKQDELNSLVAGMQFVLSTVVGECYTFRPKEDPIPDGLPLGDETKIDGKEEIQQIDGSPDEDNSKTSVSESEGGSTAPKKIHKLDRWTRKVQRDTISYSSAYPYMLVTIGTGVSVLRVDGPRKHERVSGSTIGGGTFWGLMRLLTDVENFEDAMKLAEKGDPTKVDMMVGDIYGKDSNALEKLGLAADIVASSFGKLVSKDDPATGLTQEDLARALLSLVTNNIGQVAYLNAKLHNTPRIYFVGSFLRHNMISLRRLSYAIDYWSKGEMEALFLEHEGYFGALGAFLTTQNIEKKDCGFFQWKNNP